jgi:hypothetical protein
MPKTSLSLTSGTIGSALIGTSILIASALSHPAFAQVNLDFSGNAVGPGQMRLDPKACNATPWPQILNGWRFQTPSFPDWDTWYGNLSHTGSKPYSYQQIVPDYDELLLPGKCQGVSVDYSGTMTEGQDGTPFNSQLLMKTGSCREQPPYPDADPVECLEIPAYRDADAYYADRCIIDSLGANGGEKAGGFVSSFRGETQIQVAIPADQFMLNSTEVRWDPRALGGPMYMMSLAMVQEYLNVDMQFLQSVDAKETMFGYVQVGNEAAGSISEWQNYNRDDDQSYPAFFPKFGPCAAAYPGVMQAVPCVDGQWANAAAFYMRTPGVTPTKTGPNAPQIANATFIAALTFYWLYDALIQATDFCFADLLTYGKDKRMGIAALIPGFNHGPNSGFETPLRDPAMRNDPKASEKFDGGASDYRANVFGLLDVFESASRKSKTCGGKNPIYDAAITFPEIQRFFFGGRDTLGTPVLQGDGGLLLHFDLSPGQRVLALADLQCAFDRLKGRAPSTQGMDAISFRYDWLTLLRAAKGRLHPHRSVPVQGEFKDWVDARSLTPKACGPAVSDKIYPNLRIASPAQDASVGAAFTVDIEASDNAKVTGVEWTLDTTWNAWNPAGMAAPGKYPFQVSCDQPDYPAAGKSGALWIRVTDGCGNSTVQRLGFRVNAGTTCVTESLTVAAPVASPASREFSGNLEVTLASANPGATIFYTLDGTPPATTEGGSTRRYRGPVNITATTSLQAIAGKAGFRTSDRMIENYVLVAEPVSGNNPIDKEIPSIARTPIKLRVTFPNGSADFPAAGAEAQPGSPAFIPVNSQGVALPGNGSGKCGSCVAADHGLFVGPVIHILTSGPVDYDFKIFSNLGEFLAQGSGSIDAADLPSLGSGSASPNTAGTVSAGYDAPIVWTGRTLKGQKAGTGAYVLMAVFKYPSGTAGGPMTRQTEKTVFGLMRK